MSRRKTVRLNLEFVNPRIKQIFRSNVVFCEKMGRAHNWVTDWNRTNKETGEWEPKNLPSPEEAAQMCILLKAEPEEILQGVGATDEETAKLQADIQHVRELVAEQNAKKAPGVDAEGLSEAKMALWQAVSSLTDEQCEKLLGIVLEAKKLM